MAVATVQRGSHTCSLRVFEILFFNQPHACCAGLWNASRNCNGMPAERFKGVEETKYLKRPEINSQGCSVKGEKGRKDRILSLSLQRLSL